MKRYLTNLTAFICVLTVIMLFFNSCTSKHTADFNSGEEYSMSTTIKVPESATHTSQIVDIKDSAARNFVERFNNKNTFPIFVNKELFDSSRVIPDELVKKYIKGNSTQYYYGTRFLVRGSIYGLIYHYLYKFVPEQIWIAGIESVGSNILYLNAEGKEMARVHNAYYNDKGFDEIGEYEKRNLTSIMKEGELFLSRSEKRKEIKDGELLSYEEVKSSTYYSWNSKNKLVKGKTTLDAYKSDEVNPTARKAILDTLEAIKGITFIGVVKQNDEYYRINSNCVAATEYHIIDTPEELKNSNFSYIHERYLPIWVDENSEYSSELIVNPSSDKVTREYSFTVKSFEIFKDDYPVINMRQQGNEMHIIRSDAGYWMVKPKAVDDKFFMEEKFALTLPISNYSCNQ